MTLCPKRVLSRYIQHFSLTMDFLRKIAGAEPLPAGGAAAAYTLGLAVGLLNKVVLLEIYRHADSPDVEKNLLLIKKGLEKLLKDIEILTQEDAETFKRFDQSRRANITSRLEVDFTAAIDVSMSLLRKSDETFDWIRHLHPLTLRQMIPHLLVASELVMGAINATSHVVRDNIHSTGVSVNHETDLQRLNALQEGYHDKYLGLIQQLTPEV